MLIYYLHKSWFRSVWTALWCGITITRESCALSVLVSQNYKSSLYFSLFLAGHTLNKTLLCRTTEGWEGWFGHYLVKEYNLSCICILYISLNAILCTEDSYELVRFSLRTSFLIRLHVLTTSVLPTFTWTTIMVDRRRHVILFSRQH